MSDFENPYMPLSAFMPGGASVEEGFSARAGAPLQPGAPVADKDKVIEAISEVYDPEIPVNIYELGLIYEIDIAADGSVAVQMSLTAPGCPVAGEMPGMVADAAAGVEGIGEVQVTLTWEPPWNPDMMTEDAKLALGMF